jgi:hypothetical protein
MDLFFYSRDSGVLSRHGFFSRFRLKISGCGDLKTSDIVTQSSFISVATASQNSFGKVD